MNHKDRRYPSYLNIQKEEFERRIDLAFDLLEECRVCPRCCGIDRTSKERGECRAGAEPYISSFNGHFGEEPPITGHSGSGTVFFTYCNLHCTLCQNYDISQLGAGEEITCKALARIMMRLKAMGCHNINLVSPSHQVPQIMKALYLASESGLDLPIVYNTNAYDSVEVLKLLDGIVDVYMPDMKYSKNENGMKYSTIPDYWDVSKMAIKEMHRQVGDLIMDHQGVAIRGLLVRHLVLPNDIAGTQEVMRFLAAEISKNTYVNLMSQYRPCFKAGQYRELNRRVTMNEYNNAADLKKRYGLNKGWMQG